MGINDPAHVRGQYVEKDALSVRASLHAQYSANKQGWANWVFQQFVFSEGDAILEIGCGTGALWAGRLAPKNARVVLTDFSPLMVEKAQALLGGTAGFSFRTMDIQEIPFPENNFDAIIANHMLYHAPDLDKALGEASRTLKDGGAFYATTIGENNLKELNDMYRGYSDAADFAYSKGLTFSLENGGDALGKYFSEIELRRYVDCLEVTSADDLMEYVASYNDLPKAVFDEMRDEIAGIVKARGMFRIEKDAGMFVCRK
ncbi:MAG: class I SAM-dependent methyltransferase [Treponema sp.]|nr:class I SAM-dependent methyltransferase [Treponema sp.]